ncbi:DUF393 domain-containing protein [Pontibacterium granulatum]|uniref:thiol-disulfide oxidoreductase DCC family protein n=1 Tax=Pontibacterium granulatum TaxID=2036029 RepID=UPI002499B5D8|nr:DUF393 domain-containing protein [Pontibacterium granulatum]MDI3324121.1 DUF393 domain-containing protein [Pontibacterium granulatum]
MTKPDVFYDGRCPLCRKEIAHYMRLDRQHKINWLDIWTEQESLAQKGVLFKDAMKLLHTVDRNGAVKTGAYSFVLIWHELPYYRHLARLVEMFHLTDALDIAYRRFARWRYRSRCKEGCGLP